MLGISANAARANLCLAKGTLAAALVEEDKALEGIGRYVLAVRQWAKHVPRPVKFELLIATVMTLDGMDLERAHGGAGDGGADAIGSAPTTSATRRGGAQGISTGACPHHLG